MTHRLLSTTHPFTAPLSRRRLVFATAGLLSAIALGLPKAARAGALEDTILELQQDWEVIKYQTAAAEREKRFEALAAKAHKVTEANAGRPEPLIWEGIIVSSWAGEKGGLGALSLVKQSKAMYESALQIDPNALDGAGYTSLAVLYYKVPGWPLGFGDKKKAQELLQKALAINPKGIDPNFFQAELLVETKRGPEAVPFLEKALQAPARPGRQIADAGRREEARALIEKIKAM